jgi:hypothetical protein
MTVSRHQLCPEKKQVDTKPSHYYSDIILKNEFIIPSRDDSTHINSVYGEPSKTPYPMLLACKACIRTNHHCDIIPHLCIQARSY